MPGPPPAQEKQPATFAALDNASSPSKQSSTEWIWGKKREFGREGFLNWFNGSSFLCMLLLGREAF